MLGELAALGAALSWAVGGLIVKPVAMKFETFSLNALRTAAAWPAVLVFLVLTGKTAEIGTVNANSAAYIIGSGIVGVGIGTTVYLKALSLEDISKVYPVTFSCWLLSTAFIAAIFLREAVTWLIILGAFVIILGMFLLVVSPGSKKQRTVAGSTNVRGIILALAAGLCWATGTTILKLGLASTGAVVANLIRLPPIVLLLSMLALLTSGTGCFSKFHVKDLGWVGMAGVMDQAVAAVLFFISIQLAGVAKATILSSTSPLFVAGFAVLFLKEKVTLRTFLGTLCCVAGIWLTILTTG